MANATAKNGGGLSKQPTGKVSLGTKTPGGEYNQKATVIQDGDPNYYQKATVVPDEDYNQNAKVIMEDEWDQYNQNATIVPDRSWDQKMVGGILDVGGKVLQGAATAAKNLSGDKVDTSSGLPKDVNNMALVTGGIQAARQALSNGGAPNNDPSNNNPSNNDPSNNNPSTNNPSGGGSGSGSSSGSSGGGGGYNSTGYSDATLLAQALSAAGLTADPYQLPEISGPNAERLEHVDTTELKNLLQQIVDSQKQQANAQIDYGVEQGVNELTRAMEDAANQYQTQRNQATADELRALDNQALYSEARGDRGGIGEAQYASIQAAAAQNRRAVNDAQTKLGTDTSRQIADLRSKGEFQKADQLLSITQSYLKDLMGLEQWALEANLGVDEFNSRLQQWVDEYNLNVQQFLTDLDLSSAQLTGVFANGKQTAATKQRLNESLASSGSALLSAGVLPSRQQLEAMGMTETQAKAYIKKISG